MTTLYKYDTAKSVLKVLEAHELLRSASCSAYGTFRLITGPFGNAAPTEDVATRGCRLDLAQLQTEGTLAT